MKPARFIGDRFVFAVCLVVAVFWAGVELGKYNRPAICPVVAGETVISTVDHGKEQYCTYAPSYGFATKKRKV